MIAGRRILAVVLALPLLAAMTIAVIAGAAFGTVLSGDHLADTLDKVDFAHRVHTDGLQTLISRTVTRQDESLPENLGGMNLPSDDESAARMTEVLRTLFPESLIHDQTDEFLREFVPWITGQRGSFAWQVTLHDPLLATFGPRGTSPGLFQQTWLDLDMSHRMLQGRADQQMRERTQNGGMPGEPTFIDRLGPNLVSAEDWTDDALLEVISSMVPYLVGETNDFDIHLDFTSYPELAEPLSGMLRSDETTLRQDGWRFNSVDLQQRLRDSDNVAVNNPNRTVELFRPGGTTFTSDDFTRRVEAQRTRNAKDGHPDGGPNVTEVRRFLRLVRIGATWGTALVVLLLGTAIGYLGGHDGRSRVWWGAAAVTAAGTLLLVAAGTLITTVIVRAVDNRIAEERATPGPALPDALREPALDLIRNTVHDIGGAMLWRAALWVALGVGGLILAHQWGRLRPLFRRAVLAPDEG